MLDSLFLEFYYFFIKCITVHTAISVSTPYPKFLCKFLRIFFREYRSKNGSVVGYAEYF